MPAPSRQGQPTQRSKSLFGRVRRLLCRTDARPVAILVLGMHRSGTSSVAGSLMRLGGDAPLHLMPAQPDNERGFWESSVISALNDEILAAGGSDWQDWRSFDLNRIDRGVATTLRARARSVLLAEFGEARLPIIKDPRMCRLMPFWSSVFQDLEWSAARCSALEVAARSGLVAQSPRRHCAELRLSDLVAPRPGGRGRKSRDASSGPELARLSRRSAPLRLGELAEASI